MSAIPDLTTTSSVASALMNFAKELTNIGESIVYVCVLLIGIHLLFNFKIDKVLFRNNKVTPVARKDGSRHSGSGCGSGNGASERHFSVALNNIVHIVSKQSKRISGSYKLKPVPRGIIEAPFNDIGKVNTSKAGDMARGCMLPRMIIKITQ